MWTYCPRTMVHSRGYKSSDSTAAVQFSPESVRASAAAGRRTADGTPTSRETNDDRAARNWSVALLPLCISSAFIALFAEKPIPLLWVGIGMDARLGNESPEVPGFAPPESGCVGYESESLCRHRVSLAATPGGLTRCRWPSADDHISSRHATNSTLRIKQVAASAGADDSRCLDSVYLRLARRLHCRTAAKPDRKSATPVTDNKSSLRLVPHPQLLFLAR